MKNIELIMGEAARASVDICPNRAYAHPVHGHPICEYCEPIRDAIVNAQKALNENLDNLKSGAARVEAIYTDGSAIGNPGPGGIGVVIVEKGGRTRELTESLPHTTNNFAELFAVMRACGEASTGTVIYTDSQWVQGVLTKNWRVKTHVDFVLRVREAVHEKSLRVEWTRGHVENPLNERADSLAYMAAQAAEARAKGSGGAAAMRGLRGL